MTISPVNAYGTYKWIVSATAGQGTHTTIASALTAASSGDDIFIRPGTYTENLTLKAGVNLIGSSDGSMSPSVIIVGKATYTVAGTVNIFNCKLQTNSDYVLEITGTAVSIVNLQNCYLNLTNNSGLHLTSSGGGLTGINLTQCNGDTGTTGIAYHVQTNGGINYYYCDLLNSGASTTASDTSNGAAVQAFYSSFNSPFSTTGASSRANLQYSSFSTSAQNATSFSFNGTGLTTSKSCWYDSGSASAITVGTGATLNITGGEVKSSNTNAITGLGSINYSCVSFSGSSSLINTSTPAAFNMGNNIAFATASAGTSLTIASGTAITSFVQGTFTPGIAFGGASVGVTYTTQLGFYTKINRMVNFAITMTLSSKGSSTGTATITGLPVTNGSTGIPMAIAADYTVVGARSCNVNASATTINLQQITDTGTLSNISDTVVSGTANFYINGTYYTN